MNSKVNISFLGRIFIIQLKPNGLKLKPTQMDSIQDILTEWIVYSFTFKLKNKLYSFQIKISANYMAPFKPLDMTQP